MTSIWGDRRPIALGLFTADVIAAVLFAAFTYLTDKSADDDFVYLIVLLPVGAIFSLIAIIVFALPLIIVLGRFRTIKLAPTLVAGFFIGAVMAGITEWPSNGLSEVVRVTFSDHAVQRIWAFATIGCASALGFWFVRKSSSMPRVVQPTAQAQEEAQS